jgi:hypothetical protein
MTSSQSITLAAVFSVGLVFGPGASADPVSDGCAALVSARSALYSMLSARDKSAQEELKAQIQQASVRLDSVLAAMTGADVKKAAEFKTVWDQFKATRDKEIIPAMEQGNFADAKRIADSIQLDRLSKMWSIMSCR